MKVSSLKVLLTGEDLKDILNDVLHEFINMNEFIIDRIEIKEVIEVYGKYNNTVSIPFKVVLGIGNVKDNILHLMIFKVSVYKIPILGFIKNLALKKVLQEYASKGIMVNKNVIMLNLKELSKIIPYIDFNLKYITTKKDKIEVEIEKIIYVQDKVIENNKDEEKISKTIKRVQDNYSLIRKALKNKFPDKYKKLSEYILIIPDVIVLFYRLLKDPRVSLKTKLFLGGAVTYLASPINLIPNFIPVIGEIDDVTAVLYTLNKILDEVPEQVILDNWQGREDFIQFATTAIQYFSGFLKSKRVSKYKKHSSKKSRK